MENVFNLISIVTAGAAIPIGIFSLSTYIQDRSEKVFLSFSIMSLSLAVFYLIPPIGLVIREAAPYPVQLEIKRFFIYCYYAIIPLFLFHYTGYRRPYIFYINLGLVVLSFLLMLLTRTEQPTPSWFIVALAFFTFNMFLGIRAGIWQLKNGNKRDAFFLLAVFAIYSSLYVLAMLHQFFAFEVIIKESSKYFYPFHLHSIFFQVIMGILLYEKAFDKTRLERIYNARGIRWSEFMQNVPIIVIEYDVNETILFINKHGLQTLGFNSMEEINGKRVSDLFQATENQNQLRRNKSRSYETSDALTFFNNSILTPDGHKRSIIWIRFPVESEYSDTLVNILIGTDVTEEESRDELIEKLKLEIDKENITDIDTGKLAANFIIGSGEVIQYILRKISLVSATGVTVLIEGETGVGKELVADLIYENSARKGHPFKKINCGALPRDLIEDELFGHEKGAFTSAHQARKGMFEQADGGTIFLDEIADLPIELQPKLLRVLQDGQFERIGGQKSLQVDVRIIAATNRNLEEEVQHKRFREDLFYRLNVFPITVPPLRKRKEDLPDLINYFVSYYSNKYGKNILQISKADLQQLINHPWPGNVRELKNVIERSVLLSQGTSLKLNWSDSFSETEKELDNKSLDEINREHIIRILEECDWKINGKEGAAYKLQMNPNTLRSRMKKLRISRPLP
jgi:PAS domain S-box-containing protein